MDAGWRGSLRDILDRGCAQGVFRADVDPSVVAMTIMTTIKGIGLQAMMTPDSALAENAMSAMSVLIERWVLRHGDADPPDLE